MSGTIKNITGFKHIEKIWFKGIELPYDVKAYGDRFAVCIAAASLSNVYSVAFVDIKTNTVSRGIGSSYKDLSTYYNTFLDKLEKGEAEFNPTRICKLEVVKILYDTNIK